MQRSNARRIKQELEIASVLPEGPERRGFEEQARDRSAVYVHRRTSAGTTIRRPRGPGWWPRPSAVPLIALLLFCASVAESADEDSFFWPDLFYNIAVGVFVVWAGLLGYWISFGIKVWLRRNFLRAVDDARAVIDPTR